ncbi:MAG TPA: hypothetical protein VFS67_01325 [Polyangiaceae bacterium]|jgi:hypothetical protein|nr:hypothetical protein [Polyangiaceae bacterium]
MPSVAHAEIQRLRTLHQRADLELTVLQKRPYWTAEEEREVLALKRLKLKLKDRMAWVEAILREHEAPVERAQKTVQPSFTR